MVIHLTVQMHIQMQLLTNVKMLYAFKVLDYSHFLITNEYQFL